MRFRPNSSDAVRSGRQGARPRRIARTLCLLGVAASTAVSWSGSWSVAAADGARDIAWKDLVPPAAVQPPPRQKTFFSGSTPVAGAAPEAAAPPPPPMPEGKWMSRARKQPGAGQPANVVKDLDGKLVRIGGYVVPLDFDSTKVKEFLLVPFVGACIHVPPPPTNQIVYVKAANGFEVQGAFDPVWVTGTMKTEMQFTGLAETGYSLEADKVELRKE